MYALSIGRVRAGLGDLQHPGGGRAVLRGAPHGAPPPLLRGVLALPGRRGLRFFCYISSLSLLSELQDLAKYSHIVLRLIIFHIFSHMTTEF